MISTPNDGWSFATAREPARLGARQVNGVPGVDHAVGARGTLCGTAMRYTTRYLHLFEPDALQSCRRCGELAAAVPTQPCVQERLHARVEGAAPGSVRDDLLAALRRGANVRLWINGPSAGLARDHAKLDGLTDGAGPAAEACGTAPTIGMARVEDGPWRFLVVLPEDGGRPVVARGPLDRH
ncbi:hypothetical protein [Kitasatospora aureofaciens]|uniref:hypothetical protein n=1 Tax=Kitasatospora aureofaciens TaxID=1894 RepID=UPI001C482784|nr:hypothetical protein [Kitasatospora aureofaciens]MBV6699829.1 hypothetical protein [Kitasatospora aureofaciens]